MNEHERAQGFLGLYKQQMQNRHYTQEVEWKANIGFWTLLAGANYVLVRYPISISPCYAFLICLTTVVMHGWWLRMIHNSEEADKRLWCCYRKEALLELRRGRASDDTTETIKPPQDEKRMRRSEWLWLIPELWLTLALSGFLFFLMIKGHP